MTGFILHDFFSSIQLKKSRKSWTDLLLNIGPFVTYMRSAVQSYTVCTETVATSDDCCIQTHYPILVLVATPYLLVLVLLVATPWFLIIAVAVDSGVSSIGVTGVAAVRISAISFLIDVCLARTSNVTYILPTLAA